MSGAWRLPTFRPVGPVPSDRETDWMPLLDAVRMLAPALVGAKKATDWLMRHIRSGELPITCRLLTYRKNGDGMSAINRHEWPGREARLAEQIEQALSHPLSGFRALSGTGDFEWLDVTGDYAVDTRMSFPHVDRATLLSYFPQLQKSEPSEQGAVVVAPPPPPSPSVSPAGTPTESLKDFVRACAVVQPKWTVAYRDLLIPAKADGRFPNVGRESFRKEYAKIFPNPKPGR